MRGVLVLGLVWGSSVFLQRVAVSQIDPLTMVTLRLLAAFAFFVPFAPRITRALISRKRVALDVGVVGLLNPTATAILSAYALQRASAGVVAVFNSLGPVISAILATTFLHEQPLRREQFTGLAVAFAGVVMLIATGSTGLTAMGRAGLFGQGMALAVALLTALSAVYARWRLGATDSVAAAGGQIATSLLAVGLIRLVMGGPLRLGAVTYSGWLAVILSGAIGLSASFILFMKMIARHGATATLLAVYVMPVTAAVLGSLFLRETVTVPMASGSLLVLAGVFLFTGWRHVRIRPGTRM